MDAVNKQETEQAKPRLSFGALSLRLWREYLRPYWPRLALTLVAMGVYAASASAIPVGVEWINAGLTGGTERFSPDLSAVMVFGPLLVVFMGAINATSQYVQTRLSTGAALSAIRDLQNDMFAALMRMDFAQQREEVSGQIVSRFTNDTLVMRETLSRVALAVRDVLTLLGLCGMMIYYDWALFLVVLMVYPVIGIPVDRIGRYLRNISGRAQAQVGEVTALIGETVTGARMVKSFQLEPLERARAAFAFDKRLDLLKKMAYARAMNEPVIFFAGSVALAIVVAIVAMRISSGALTAPEFVAFIIALLLMSQPARALGTLNAVMQEGFGAFERVVTFIDSQPSIEDAPNAAPLRITKGAIKIEKAVFSYPDGERALKEVSLEAAPGETIALVGVSGAGKSTLLNLLPRLYDLESGRILIDGQNIAQGTLHSLRQSIAMVSQDPVIFNLSALENIAFGRPSASRAEIIKAAEAAAANEFIAALPQGYDTSLGEAGGRLSGGQRQRIALARAFLKDAPILLLDEATSALDAESEAKIQEALERLAEGRTTLVIAHRLSTVRNADKILVMEAGEIVEMGKHDELIAKAGVYARHAALQFG